MKNTGPHPFEQCIHLAGTDDMPVKIQSKLGIWNSVGNAEDYVFAVLEYENGTSGFYHRLYDHMFNGGELFIKPEHILTEVRIFEEIERQNPLEQKVF